ncbi:hypothetical protein FRB90_011681 [Tulasnella sp. 427]|nr:hypothetical protein FRB90_011681 [Tulasnella sp. 427]
MSSKNWQDIAIERKQKQESLIPPEWRIEPVPEDLLDVSSVPKSCGLLTDRELEITDTINVDVLLSKLANGTWTSVEVTKAFYKRAIIAHQLTNCLTEIFIERALDRAQQLDDFLKTNGRTVGPLHGLPISLKDQFCMKGLETIMGYVSWIGTVSDHDAAIVEILYELGANPFVRTNVPQTLMWGETFNNVFGRTTNPFNRRLTPGGSSGGEGALIALRGSPLGVGTDIGGSVRIPAGFTDIYSLRPCYARLPYEGAANVLEGQESITSAIGPMTSHISGLKIFTKAVLDAKPWNKDPLVVRKPWSDAEYGLSEHGGAGAKLCFAVMLDNGLVRPQPPVRRAMSMVVSALEEAGHKVIDWENKLHLEIHAVNEHILSADGGEDYRTICSITGEPVLQTMMPNAEQSDPHHPWDPHPTFLDEPFTITLRNAGQGAVSAYELWKLHKRKTELRKQYLDHWENTKKRTGTGRPVDAILCPVAPYPAPPHGHNRFMLTAPQSNDFYTCIWNNLDYAAASFPVTKVDPNLDTIESPPESFYNQEDEAVFKLYKPEVFLNAPVGLQLVGRTQEEEAVIAMTEIAVSALETWKRVHDQS